MFPRVSSAVPALPQAGGFTSALLSPITGRCAPALVELCTRMQLTPQQHLVALCASLLTAVPSRPARCVATLPDVFSSPQIVSPLGSGVQSHPFWYSLLDALYWYKYWWNFVEYGKSNLALVEWH